MPASKLINIEAEFPVAVRRAGGDVVADLLPTKSPKFDNADYLFRSHNVVAELKCLDKNVVADPDFAAKLSRLYLKLMRDGRAPMVFGRVRVSLEQIARLDQRAALEFVEPYKKRLGKVLLKANNQIKETAEHFGVAEPKGLLVLANDGDMGLEFGLVLHLLHRLLKGCYGSINTVLYFTANVTVNTPNFQPALMWAPLEIPGRQMVAEQADHLCERRGMRSCVPPIPPSIGRFRLCTAPRAICEVVRVDLLVPIRSVAATGPIAPRGGGARGVAARSDALLTARVLRQRAALTLPDHHELLVQHWHFACLLSKWVVESSMRNRRSVEPGFPWMICPTRSPHRAMPAGAGGGGPPRDERPEPSVVRAAGEEGVGVLRRVVGSVAPVRRRRSQPR